ncbi:transposable element Tcb1 transposase [Trichonephila clavipes]|nr:transposable element Tcb1 transposase [Trichonephila clavipes]
MSLRRFRRRYEQLSQIERERIIVMMEAGWSARRVARQLGRSDCVVRRSDDNRVRAWRPRGERLNPAFALQRHTAPTAGVMVWGAIAYNTWSPLVLIRGTMTAQRYVHDILQPHVLPLMQRLPGTIFQQDIGRPHTARLSPHCYYPSMACPIPRLFSNRTYLGSFGTAWWASHEFERTRGKVTANMERNVSRHHTELVCLNARSYRIVHS